MPKATQSRKSPQQENPIAEAVAEFERLDHRQWVSALMIASLMEPCTTTAVFQHLTTAGIRDAAYPNRDRAITSDEVKEAVNQLRKLGIVAIDQSNKNTIDENLANHIVASAATTDTANQSPPNKQPKSKLAAPASKNAANVYTNRNHNFQLICQHIFDHSGIHFFGFSGLNRRLHVLRELRAHYWLGQFDELVERVEDDSHCLSESAFRFFLEPLDATRIASLPVYISVYIYESALIDLIRAPQPADHLLAVAETTKATPSMLLSLGEVHLLRGDVTALTRLFETIENAASDSDRAAPWLAVSTQLRASLLLCRGEIAAAIAAFEDCLRHIKGKTRRRNLCPPGLGAMFLCCALCQRGDPESLRLAAQYVKWGHGLKEVNFFGTLDMLDDFILTLSGGQAKIEYRIASFRQHYLEKAEPNLFTLLFIVLSRTIGETSEQQKQWQPILKRITVDSEAKGFLLLAFEASSLRDSLSGSVPDGSTKRLLSRLDFHAVSFTTAFKISEPWQKTLLGLEKIASQHAPKAATKSVSSKVRKELIWVLETWNENLLEGIPSPCNWNLFPMERNISATGRVSKGRKVALRRLKENPEKIVSASAQDLRIVPYILKFDNWRHYSEYDITSPAALLILSDHPLIYADSNLDQPIELIRSTPRLDVSDRPDGGVDLQLLPAIDFDGLPAALIRESDRRFVIYEVLPIHHQLRDLLRPTPKSLEATSGSTERVTTIPAAARDRLHTAIAALAGEITIEADHTLGDSATAQTETIDADAVPHLRLLPAARNQGLDIRILIRPVPGSSIDHPPGEGKAVLLAVVDGKSYQASRDLVAEKSAAEQIVEHCPSLHRNRDEFSDPWQWRLDDPANCLQLLNELHDLDDTQVRIEWPEGQPFRLVGRADSEQFRLSLSGSTKGNWLKASGELQVNDQLVLSMRQLLDLVYSDASGSSAFVQRGFVELGEGEFLVLSASLRRQLDDLRAAASISGASADDEIRIHPLAAIALEDLTRSAIVKGKKSKAWREQLDRIEAARDHHPDPPNTLRAELRPYQLDGYRWLSRLAVLGAGACLADDMGLGKTVQALALLIERAPLGPSLVIAPTSVATNWITETQRFAPPLTPKLFGDGDRAAMLDALRPGDLVILSYGLLHSEIEKLAAIQWNTVILDEAQAIKNRTTQRSKAAMKLSAGFRIITTGTPVENRIAELHNLFHFINPGLLGSWQNFQPTFADPIENATTATAGADAARSRLRRLIRPFLLRRLKSEVLRDLPARTDIELSVEPSAAETAFYEALRQKAVEEIESATDDDGPGAIRILAQLTRLRRACCHPQLINPDSDVPSSKLKVFADTLEEILAGGHKVLVFSQFVDHLALVREHLETERIAYQYLDGSTPRKKRQQAVDAFQSGDGDVFLISLKAGGFGLNLTAADYVIHLDPWWNPAAEDQASDRAHRIGQKRPVTVYRLIVRDTIEEKIVALHHQKRDLADSLLEGTGKAARLTPDDMLELLRS